MYYLNYNNKKCQINVILYNYPYTFLNNFFKSSKFTSLIFPLVQISSRADLDIIFNSLKYFYSSIAKSFTQLGSPKFLFKTSTATAKLSAPSSVLFAGKPKSFEIS